MILYSFRLICSKLHDFRKLAELIPDRIIACLNPMRKALHIYATVQPLVKGTACEMLPKLAICRR